MPRRPGPGSAEVVVTSDYSGLEVGSLKARRGRERKDGTFGPARMTMEIQYEPLVHNFDDVAQAQLIASAAAELIKKKVGAITEEVEESTQLTRKAQEQAWWRGEHWVQDRFSGGRTGLTPPRESERRYFNHSGRFRESIVGTPNRTEGTATLNVAANRLNPSTSRGPADFRHITDALLRLVPELADPQALVSHPEMQQVFQEASDQVVFNAAQRNKRLRGELGLKLIDEALSRMGLGGLRGKAATAIYG